MLLQWTQINSSQWNAQSTTPLLYLLTKNNRTIILHQGDTRGHGTANMSVTQKCFSFPGNLPRHFARRLFINHGKQRQRCGTLNYPWFSWPLLLPTRAGSGLRQVRYLGAILKEVLKLGALQVLTLHVHDPDREPSTPPPLQDSAPTSMTTFLNWESSTPTIQHRPDSPNIY